MKRAIKTFGLMALLLSLLLQGVVMTSPGAPPTSMSKGMSMATCGHHLPMTQHPGHGCLSHSQCCQCANCNCMQTPALMNALASMNGFVRAAQSAPMPSLLPLMATPSAKVFRPPI